MTPTPSQDPPIPQGGGGLMLWPWPWQGGWGGDPEPGTYMDIYIYMGYNPQKWRLWVPMVNRRRPHFVGFRLAVGFLRFRSKTPSFWNLSFTKFYDPYIYIYIASMCGHEGLMFQSKCRSFHKWDSKKSSKVTSKRKLTISLRWL